MNYLSNQEYILQDKEIRKRSINIHESYKNQDEDSNCGILRDPYQILGNTSQRK